MSTHFDRRRAAAYYARFALAGAFLSAVAGRFGLWHRTFDMQYFQHFIQYTGQVLAFMPAATVPFLAWAATVCETTLAVLLIAGLWPRWVAWAAAVLLAMFATSMAISLGPKAPLDYSVYSASAAAVLLALQAEDAAATRSEAKAQS